MIIFNNDLLNSWNPAYNDSIVSFESTMSGITNCSITIGTNDFVVYPFNNVFKFNFKPVVTTLINQNGFKDSILPDLSGGDFIFEDESLQLKINPEFFCYNSTTHRTINGVQHGQSVFTHTNSIGFDEQCHSAWQTPPPQRGGTDRILGQHRPESRKPS